MGCVTSHLDKEKKDLNTLKEPVPLENKVVNEVKVVTVETKEYELLCKCTYKNTEPFMPSFTKCFPVKIYDGDTIWAAAIVDGKCFRFNIRMYGYDSPELRSKNPDEKLAAVTARDALASKIEGKLVTVHIHNIKEKFGRLLCTLYDDQGNDINEWMISSGYGKPYFGGTKEEFELKNIDTA